MKVEIFVETKACDENEGYRHEAQLDKDEPARCIYDLVAGIILLYQSEEIKFIGFEFKD